MNKNQNARAAETYTGTRATDINSVKERFFIAHSHAHSFLSKKYSSPNIGDKIAKNHNHTTLTKSANHNARRSRAYAIRIINENQYLKITPMRSLSPDVTSHAKSLSVLSIFITAYV
jgi:hypothetical protein